MREVYRGLAVFFLSANIFGQNLLENGSFEYSTQNPGNSVSLLNAGSNGLENWTIGGNGVTYIGTLVTPPDGIRSVHLHRGNAGWVEQKIATLAGQKYRAYYQVSAYVNPPRAAVVQGRATATSAAGGTLTNQTFSYDGTGKSFPNPGFAQFQFDVTANSTNLTFRFESLEGGSAGPIIDNIRVVPGRDDGSGNWIIDGALVFGTRMPRDTQVAISNTVNLQVNALGSGPISYQWYKRTSSTFNILAGATSSSLLVGPATNASAGTYRVIATNSLGSVTNDTILTVVRPPAFGTPPEEQRVSVGNTLTLNASSFSGSAPDRFQWYKDNEPIPGATNSFVQKTAALTDNGTYYLKIGNIAGETNSPPFQVVVVQGPVAPWIRSRGQPAANLAIELGSSIFMNAQIEGTFPISFFWYKDNIILPGQNQNFFSKTATNLSDSGVYYLVATNAAGSATSSNVNVVVYPQQQFPQFANSPFQTNIQSGASFTLMPPLTQGSHLVFQWYRRGQMDNLTNKVLLLGQTNHALTFQNPGALDTAYYTLVATNYKGYAEKETYVNVVSPPLFSSSPGGYEGPEGGSVSLSANLVNGTSTTTYKWYKDDNLILNATNSNYTLTPSTTTAGSYTVVAKNEAGETMSPPALVTIRAVTPGSGQWVLVANQTTSIPGRAGLRFTTVGDATLKNSIVTFQGVTNSPDIGGIYRWQAGTIIKVVDLTDILPSFTATANSFDGSSAEDGGITTFVANSTNSPAGNQAGVFAAQNGGFHVVANQQTSIPGKTDLKFGRLGYTTRASGKTAFLGANDPFFGPGYRGVFVWDGVTLSNWANSDQPLARGGVWTGNSAQLGFDGATAAFWGVTTVGQGIFKTVNGAPLETIAFTGDAIPGGLGTFKSFSSPPHVEGGKVLFLAQANENSLSLLMEHSVSGLRVIAKTGDSPQGGGAFRSIPHGFDYTANGDILFTAYGPGEKQGIYRWSNGAVTEELTSLNTLLGTRIRYIGLYETDGDDKVITVSFNGSSYGLYASVGNNSTGPQLSFSVTANNLTLNWGAGQTLQVSTNLTQWNDVNSAPPKVISPATDGVLNFYRLIVR